MKVYFLNVRSLTEDDDLDKWDVEFFTKELSKKEIKWKFINYCQASENRNMNHFYSYTSHQIILWGPQKNIEGLLRELNKFQTDYIEILYNGCELVNKKTHDKLIKKITNNEIQFKRIGPFNRETTPNSFNLAINGVGKEEFLLTAKWHVWGGDTIDLAYVTL